MRLKWFDTYQNRTQALVSLGKLGYRHDLIAQAVIDYQNMILACDRAQQPLRWAGVMFHLGEAFLFLAHPETTMEKLDRSLSAFDQALESFTRNEDPTMWAVIQHKLGYLWLQKGQISQNAKNAEMAINACRQALMVRTENRVLVDYAETQANLAQAFWLSGILTANSQFLLEAQQAFEKALSSFKKLNLPRDVTQTSQMYNSLNRAISDNETSLMR